MFVMTGGRYIGVLFHTFYYYWAEKFSFVIAGTSLHRSSLYQGSNVPGK